MDRKERFVMTVTALLMAVVAACAREEVREPLASGADERPAVAFSDPATIDNPYLPLTKFAECTLEGAEGDTEIKVVRTLTDETKQITWDGRTIEPVVMRDREWEDGELVEETHDWFAQSDDGTVYYFGEAVDNYEDGKIANHDGAWELGKDTDNPGVLMPADVAVGSR
ncbi:MAG: hypothetical protein WD826_01545, partial [Actinomycetota bacterium]